MKRSEFDHAVRAAAAVLDTNEILVIGSQAIHASIDTNPPPEAERSVEVDIVPIDDSDGRLADLLDGSIGEASMFHESFGYYAQGVSETTAVLPEGWRERLIRYETPATNRTVAWCLDPHDLWISKAIAGRQKDIEFCEALLVHGVVSEAILIERLGGVTRIIPSIRQRVEGMIRRSPP
mgnify:CR=1 FL=1